MLAFTAHDKLDCLKRELRMRKRVYPRLIDKGKMSADKAEREEAIIKAIIEDYEGMIRRREPELFEFESEGTRKDMSIEKDMSSEEVGDLMKRMGEAAIKVSKAFKEFDETTTHDYRLVRYEEGQRVSHWIHGAYYNEGEGEPFMITDNPQRPYGETPEELRKSTEEFLGAFDQPVLKYSDFYDHELRL